MNWRWIFFINIPVGIVSLFLSSRLVHDPPQLEKLRADIRARGFHIDYAGFALLTIGLGALQIVLDKGQREDWFESSFIVGLAALSVLSLVAMLWWELRQRDPVVDLSLFSNRNFVIANALMFMLGFVLLGSTALLPVFAQSLLGYTATEAGLMLSPGGLSMLLFMPLVGTLVSRVDVRWMVVGGLATTALSLFLFSRVDLDVDFATLAWLRVLQTSGLAFLFIPINTAAFAGLPMVKSSQASALINLSRNLGGSFGIALVSSFVASRTQLHQAALVSDVTAFSDRAQAVLRGLAEQFHTQGMDATQALARAQATVYAMVQKQAGGLAYLDGFMLLGAIFAVLIPFVFLLRRPRIPGTPAAAH